MDRVLSVNAKRTRMQHSNKGKKKDIKVVYISTPMKVKASASKFRAVVQQLTGKDSDTTRLNVDANYNYIPENSTQLLDDGFVHQDRTESFDLSPDLYGLAEPFAVLPEVDDDDSFMGWFESSFLFHEPASLLRLIN